MTSVLFPVHHFSLRILFRGDLLSRAHGLVEELGGVVDFLFRFAINFRNTLRVRYSYRNITSSNG